MIMICDITNIKCDFGDFADKMKALGDSMSMSIHVMHEDIFNAMHSI